MKDVSDSDGAASSDPPQSVSASSRSSSSASHRKSRRRKSKHSGKSRRFLELLPKGLRFPKIRSTRPVVRQSDLGTSRLKPEGEYGAILGRLGAISDREMKTTAGYRKIDEFAVCALRGFRLHKTALGNGTYGAELEQCLRRQARSERDRLWREKIRFSITNRIAKECPTGRFGNFE